MKDNKFMFLQFNLLIRKLFNMFNYQFNKLYSLKEDIVNHWNLKILFIINLLCSSNKLFINKLLHNHMFINNLILSNNNNLLFNKFLYNHLFINNLVLSNNNSLLCMVNLHFKVNLIFNLLKALYFINDTRLKLCFIIFV